MKKIIMFIIIAFVIIFSSAFVLSKVLLNTGIQKNESIKEFNQTITNPINFSIERQHIKTAYPNDEIEITLKLINSDDKNLQLSVSEIHVFGIEYLDNIGTKILKYENQLIPYYLWQVSVPANSNKEIKYHIKPQSPRVIDFSMAFANDQYGNQHESLSSSITILCRPDNFCNSDENYISCPEDCKAGLEDGICDAVDDGINDPDCAYGIDPDYNPYEDNDNDQVPNSYDKCPGYPETDLDYDGKPNNCDRCPYDKDNDIDNDAICGDVDNCPTIDNPDQLDSNQNGIGDVCEYISLNIPLNQNWNLISIPLTPYNDSIENVFGNIMDKVIVINGFEAGPGGGAKTYDPQLPEFSDLHTIDYKHGYWVKMNQSANLTITGTTSQNKTINLATNWNLISYLCNSTKNVSNVFNSIMSKVIVINGFENGALTYDPLLPEFSDLTELKPYHGYWVKMNQSAILDYNGVC